MSATVAPPPTSSALAPPSLEGPSTTSRLYPSIAPLGSSPGGTPSSRPNRNSNGGSPRSSEHSPRQRASSDENSSPTSASKAAAALPKVIVKKEPGSPEMANSRHRPRRLDLSKSATANTNATTGRAPASGQLTSKESAGLAIQDLGLQCLSPGFHTQDPAMREQLQRSLSVREQQRQLIEARQKGGGKGNTSTPPDHSGEASNGLFRPAKTPGTSRRKGPPPGLSIAAPSASQFANERVIQSAPLGQTFSGLGRNVHPVTRHIVNQPTPLSSTSHIHHQPAIQTNNRLPPIADVFPADNFPNGPHSSRGANFPHHTNNNSPSHSSHGAQQGPLPSPGLHHSTGHQHGPYPPPPHSSTQTSYPSSVQQSTSSGRPREYRSAEEALTQMAGGREELLPRIVHYGGHQPPTPPSPMPHHHAQKARDGVAGLGVPTGSGPSHDPLLRSGSGGSTGRRRDRDEFERDMSPPSLQQQGHGSHHAQQLHRRRTAEELRAAAAADREAHWTEGRWERDSPETRQRKKDRFISLCSEAWDLFHS